MGARVKRDEEVRHAGTWCGCCTPRLQRRARHGFLHAPCPLHKYALLGRSIRVGFSMRPRKACWDGAMLPKRGASDGALMHDLALGCQGLALRQAFGAFRHKSVEGDC